MQSCMRSKKFKGGNQKIHLKQTKRLDTKDIIVYHKIKKNTHTHNLNIILNYQRIDGGG